MKPMIPKMTKPENKAVITLPVATMTASLHKEMQYELNYERRKILLLLVLPETVIVELVVTGKCDESSPTGRKRKEDLHGCISPDSSLTEFFPFRYQVEPDAIRVARRAYSTYQQDCQDQVREQGCEVHGFAKALDALEQHEEDTGPRQQQTQSHLPVDCS